jgi:error-prone DNA polymerase
MEHELAVIAQLQMADYLLAVWDIVCFARGQGILCQGRGSAVGSLVCYCLGITAVEPLAHHLSFERFLALGRSDPPDIDLDLPADRADVSPEAVAEPDASQGRDGSSLAREAVIQYTLRRWRGHAALVSTLICFRSRLALREVGMALGLSHEQLDALSAQVEGTHAPAHGTPPAELHPAATLLALPDSRVLRRLSDLCRRIEGLPRHLGQHPGGVVLTARPLAEVAPLERARMPGRVVVQWEKESAETAGLAKIDLLGLGMLGVIDQAFALLERETGTRPALHAFRCDDPRVYDAICALDTVGVFQIESRAQLSACLPHLQPRCYEDLIVAVALIRPGPVQAGAVHPFLRRRRGEEPVAYPGGAAGRRLLEPVLGATLGICLFQDEVIDIGRAAGLSPSEAAELRRAMSSGRSKERMAALAARLDAGLAAHGLDAEARRTVTETVQAFSSYGFVKGHAAAFAYVAYVSAWLKVYHPGIFLAALLNMQPMGFYPAEVLVQDAVRHGVRVLPVELGRSQGACTVEGGAVRLGLRQLRGLGPEAGARLEAALRTLPADYGLEDLCARARLSEDEARALARGGVLGRFYPNRRQALWQAPLVARVARERWLPGTLAAADPPAALPEATRGDDVDLDRAALGFSLRGHVLAPYRAELARRSVRPLADLTGLPSSLVVELAGQAMAHQRPPTAHGVLFLSLSDETGMATVVVLPPVYARERATLRGEALLWVTGVLERRGGALTVRAKRVRPLAALLREEASPGRRATDTPPAGR